MSMEDILKVLVDSRQQSGTPAQDSDPMANLIGSLLGGQQTQSQANAPVNPNTSSGGTDLSGMMGMLEMLMGGQANSTSGTSNDPIMALLAPFVPSLAKKAKIPPELAMIVLSFVVHKLLAHHPTSGRDSNTFNFDDMLGQISSGKVDPNLLQQSGMVRELSKKTGMDEATTEQTLQLAFGTVGKTLGKLSTSSAKPSSTGAKAKSAGKRMGTGSPGKKVGR